MSAVSSTSAIQIMRHEEALRRARKRVKDMRSFYMSATMYCIVIPSLWMFNLIGGGKIWAHWATIGWGIGLTAHGLSVFAGRSFFGSEWEEKKVEEIMAREKLKVICCANCSRKSGCDGSKRFRNEAGYRYCPRSRTRTRINYSSADQSGL